MAYRFDIHKHGVFQHTITPKFNHAPPDSITVELTIQACLVTVHHDCLENSSSITNTLWRRITFEFDFSILENESQLHQSLAPYLNGLGINTGSVNYDNLVREITQHGLGMSARVANRGDKYVVLPLLANVLIRYVEHNRDDLRRALEESEAELERRNYDIVAAKGSSIEEMLKKRQIAWSV